MVSNVLESPREIIALGAMLDTILDGGTCKGGVTSCKAALESEDMILQVFPALKNRNTIERFEQNWNGSLAMSWDDETLDTSQSTEASSFYQGAPALKHVESDTISETLQIIKACAEDNDIQKMVESDRTNFTSDLSGSTSESSSSSSANDRYVLSLAQEQEDKIYKRVMPVSQKRETLHDSEINRRESIQDQQNDNAAEPEPIRKTVSSFLRKFSKLMKSQRGSTKSVPESSSMVGAQLDDEREDDAEAKRVINPEETNIDATNVEDRTIEKVQANHTDTDVIPTEVGSRSDEERDNYYAHKIGGTKLDRAMVRSIPRSSVEEIEHVFEKEVIEMATGDVYIQIPEQGFEIQMFKGHRLEL
jgi:hypothetical protein